MWARSFSDISKSKKLQFVFLLKLHTPSVFEGDSINKFSLSLSLNGLMNLKIWTKDCFRLAHEIYLVMDKD